MDKETAYSQLEASLLDVYNSMSLVFQQIQAPDSQRDLSNLMFFPLSLLIDSFSVMTVQKRWKSSAASKT